MSDNRSFFNEMLEESGLPRSAYSLLSEWLAKQPPNFLKRKSREAETIFRRLGITFAVYGAHEATERLIPFDPIPRIISAAEWRRLSAGIDQRVRFGHRLESASWSSEAACRIRQSPNPDPNL